MPIKTENRRRYPPHWNLIRQQILERAGHCCERCGVPNHVHRIKSGEWTTSPIQVEDWTCFDHEKVTYIVLTVAHLDHTPENCDPANLMALCQKCHLAHDQAYHLRGARNTRRNRKALVDLFEEEVP